VNRCPHCRAPASPTRLLFYRRHRPYVCPRYGRGSRLPEGQEGVLGVLSCGVAWGASLFGPLTPESLALAVTGMCAMMQAGRVVALRLEPLPEDKAAERRRD